MYSMQICVGNSTMNIQFNKFFNQHKDINVTKIIYENIIDMYFLVINANCLLDKIEIILLDNDELVESTIIKLDKNISFVFFEDYIYSSIIIEQAIHILFKKIERYIIKAEDGEINKVILNDKEIDVNWFIKNIYKADTGRYYRKMITLSDMCVFTRDIKL